MRVSDQGADGSQVTLASDGGQADGCHAEDRCCMIQFHSAELFLSAIGGVVKKSLDRLGEMEFSVVMTIAIFAAAKPSIGYAQEGVSFFMERLRPFGKVELRYVKDGSSKDVSARLLAASEGWLRIAMDERGSAGRRVFSNARCAIGSCIP